MERGTERIVDEYLVLAGRTGDQRALEALARRWTPKLLRYAGRLIGSADLARDVVQDTWAGAIRGLSSLDDPARFPAWIYGIAHRKAMDCLRARARQRRLSEAYDAQSVEDSNPLHADESIDMQRAIKKLSPEHREVIALFYGADLDIDEIAEVLSIPHGTVKSRLFNARRQLRELVTDSQTRRLI